MPIQKGVWFVMDDLISRQAAIEALEREKTYCRAFREGYAPIDAFEKYNMGLSDGIKAINGLPSAQPERKKGKWISVTNGRGGHECSMCHLYAPSFESGEENLSPYCPNCGARMMRGENDESALP